MLVLGLFVALVMVVHLWLAVIATRGLLRTETLTTFQKRAQGVIVWLVPVFGPWLVLQVIGNGDAKAIPSQWIPGEHLNRYVIGLFVGASMLNQTCSSTDHDHWNDHCDVSGGGFDGGCGGDGGD